MTRAPGILILLMLSILAPCAVAAERTPPGSFLQYRASTVKELTDQVVKNDIIKMRYAHHFKIAPDQVAAYFNANLKLVSLKSPLKVETWYIAKNGDSIKKTKLLPKGTLVFVNKSGEPTLSWSCGNPLRTKLTMAVKAAGSEQVAKSDLPKPTETASSEVTSADETKVLANPVETIAAAAITVPPGLVEQAATAVAANTPVEVTPAIGAMASQTVSAAPPVISSFNYAWIGGLAGLAGGIAAASGGGGGGSNRSDPPPPIPEPSGLLVTAVGLFATPIAPQIIKRLRSGSNRS